MWGTRTLLANSEATEGSNPFSSTAMNDLVALCCFCALAGRLRCDLGMFAIVSVLATALDKSFGGAVPDTATASPMRLLAQSRKNQGAELVISLQLGPFGGGRVRECRRQSPAFPTTPHQQLSS